MHGCFVCIIFESKETLGGKGQLLHQKCSVTIRRSKVVTAVIVLIISTSCPVQCNKYVELLLPRLPKKLCETANTATPPTRLVKVLLGSCLASLTNRGARRVILGQGRCCGRFWSASVVRLRTCFAISPPCEMWLL